MQAAGRKLFADLDELRATKHKVPLFSWEEVDYGGADELQGKRV